MSKIGNSLYRSPIYVHTHTHRHKQTNKQTNKQTALLAIIALPGQPVSK